MLVIKPIQEKEFQKEMCEKCSLSFCKNAMAYVAAIADDDLGEHITEYIGVMQFDIFEGYAEILPSGEFPSSDDLEAMIIMGRNCMSFIYRSLGIKRLVGKAEFTDKKYLEGFGLRSCDACNYEMDLEEFFESPCGYNKAHGGNT